MINFKKLASDKVYGIFQVKENAKEFSKGTTIKHHEEMKEFIKLRPGIKIIGAFYFSMRDRFYFDSNYITDSDLIIQRGSGYYYSINHFDWNGQEFTKGQLIEYIEKYHPELLI
jgi:hypothetical protein